MSVALIALHLTKESKGVEEAAAFGGGNGVAGGGFRLDSAGCGGFAATGVSCSLAVPFSGCLVKGVEGAATVGGGVDGDAVAGGGFGLVSAGGGGLPATGVSCPLAVPFSGGLVHENVNPFLSSKE